MRSITYIVAALLFHAVISSGLARAADEHIHCSTCGMHADTSSTEVLASIKAGSKTSNLTFCSLGCVFDMLEEKGSSVSLKGLKVLDHKTAATKNRKLLSVSDAWFLYDTERLKGSMAPFIAAFASKSDATSAQEELGGELLQWPEVKSRLTADD
jgi:hypothetical protein